MGERFDELKGNIKEGIGKVTGNERLEAEGKIEHDTAKASRETKGAAREIKSRVEEGLGKLTGDEETRARGIADRLSGEKDRAG